jgi:hexosaminidase
MKEKNIKDEHELQSYFIRRIEKYVNSKGRQIIGWDEILEGGLAPNASVMSWRGEKGGIEAAKQKHNVVMTPEPYMYFNFSQSTHEDSLTYGQYTPVEKVYSYEPVPKALDKQDEKYILGAQGNVWTEYIDNPKRLEYQVFPRMSALSEVLWTPKEKRSWSDFEKKLPALYNRYEQWGAQYSKAYYELQPSILPSPGYDGVLWKLETKNRQGNIIYVNSPTQNATHNYTSPVLITASGEYGAAITRKDHVFVTNWLRQKFSFNKATGKKIILTNPPMGNWLGSGAFTLVNGVITENKLSESKEWVGFVGKDLEAVIDLGKEETINNIRINVLKQENSWIYLPSYVEFFVSSDGKNFTSAGKQMPGPDGIWKDERRIELSLNNTRARYVKVFAKNFGVIPAGMPGAGNAAWVFADEIEVK